MNLARFFWVVLVAVGVSGIALAEEKAGESRVLKADYRPRPPEMVVAEGEQISGPLKDILEEAAGRHGFRVEWRVVPFPQSLHDLETGQVDVVPRVVRTVEREAFVRFLGPIGFQDKDIQFLVRKGQEGRIRTYEDLKGLVVGVKLATAYFDPFDADATLHKETSSDDHTLARMFIGGRFDTVAILDRQAMEGVLTGLGFRDYAFAEYRFRQRLGNFYGQSAKSRHAELFPKLNESLAEMAASGRVAAIYRVHNVDAPILDADAPPLGH
ncbi:MAG: transporter substrate-binding domain-containing protein [Magnetococcales bacterium]|nr:transporter substrate-binding domain-containing protein [Magnetococcales bacterium]MBF0157394.1 transporter substrate-binding domain-containing protein [Magnetococcales bacterium]